MASQLKVFTGRPTKKMAANLERHPPQITEVLEVGHYSTDAEGKFREDDSEMRYYLPTDLSSCCYDLHEGIDSFVRKDVRKGRDINDLLTWISQDRIR